LKKPGNFDIQKRQFKIRRPAGYSRAAAGHGSLLFL
jgi:hypothetical protein